jgi:3-oxoadipate enol-lactonase
MPFVIASDGARIHYDVIGRPGGEPVLMIQGLGTDKNGWSLQRLALAPHYRTIALDNRGAGRSDKPEGPYSLEQMASDAVSVLDALGVERAHVMGASMGGAIAQILAVTYPDRVRSLVLACTACRNHPWRRQLLTGWAETAERDGMGTLAREAARWVIGPRSLRRVSPLFGWLGPLAMFRTSHAFVAQVNAILSADEESSSTRLAELDVPTLIIVGNQDILTPRGDSEDLAERIPNAELVVISGAAHGLMIEHWRPFNRSVLAFFARVRSESNRPVAV